MANIKISELNLAEDLNNSYIPGIKENTNESFDSKKFLLDDFQNSIDANSNSILYGIDEFSNNKSYYKGEYILYDNNIYKFIEFHSPGEWISTDVTRISVFSELKSLNLFSNETLNIHLESSDNNLNTSGIIVTITYNNTNLQASCDSNGNCSFNIPKNSEYTISIPPKEGYQEVENVTSIANTSTKNVNIIYQKIELIETCIVNVVIDVNNGGSITDFNGKYIYLYNSNYELFYKSTINNGVATFNNVKKYTVYDISTPTISNYSNPIIPYSIDLNLNEDENTIYIKYNLIESRRKEKYGLYIVYTKIINDITKDYEISVDLLYDDNNNWVGDKFGISNTNVKAFHINPPSLKNQGCDYFVKIEDLTNIKSKYLLPSGISNSLVRPPEVPRPGTNYTSNYIDGKSYTYYLTKHYIINNIISSSEAINYVTSCTFEYNGKTLYGFIGSKSQTDYIFSNYNSYIKKVLSSLGIYENINGTYNILTSSYYAATNVSTFYRSNIKNNPYGGSIQGQNCPIIPFFSE